MSEEFNIRALNAGDWQAFRDLRLEALRFFPQNFGASYADEVRYTKQDWIDRIENPENRIFGRFEQGRLIATNGVVKERSDPQGKTALMVMWYMHSAYQGRGLFHDVVKAGIDWAESQPHFERIVVNHRDGNDASRRCNEKHGFTYIGREKKLWPDGKEADLLMYERRFER